MSGPGFFVRVAARNLMRGGQRMVVAVLCVAFGAMILTAMTLMSKSIERMLMLEPPEYIGADLTLDRVGEDVISEAEEGDLRRLQEAGLVERYSLIAYARSLAVRQANGETFFPGVALGVDPAMYPLAGRLAVDELQTVDLPALLGEPGDVIVTYDLALEYHLKVGDAVTISDLRSGVPLAGVIRGIATDTPNHQGSKVYYSLATAQALAGGARPVNTVVALSADAAAAATALEDMGWRVFTAQFLANADMATQQLFEFCLNGAGMLGLLVAGVGIANTMQVLLGRRRREVAVWKTLGYRSGQLQALFAMEATLLGVVGSLLGALVGIGLSYALVDLFSRTTTMLIHWVFSPAQPLMAVLVGVLTTVTFALWAIVSTSQVRPAALLRNEMLDRAQLSWGRGALLALAMLVPFMGVAWLVMGSLLKGIGAILATLAGLIGAGVGLSALAWLTTLLLPFGLWPLGNMARNNLRQRGPSLLFALIALFVGVVAMALGTVTTTTAQRVVEMFSKQPGLENVVVYAPPDQAEAVRAAADAQGVETLYQTSYASVARITSPAAPDSVISPMLLGATQPGGFDVSGAPWGSRPEGVYVNNWWNIPEGSQVEVTFKDGSAHSLEVVGTYQFRETSDHPGMVSGLLMAEDALTALTPAENMRFFLHASTQKLSETTASLAAALPGATVVSLEEFLNTQIRTYNDLSIFVAAMAGLSLLAGVLLVANSVSLAMLARRYEIGVLKAMGYSSWHVLSLLVLEYTLVAVIAVAAGLGLVAGAMSLVGLADPAVGNLLQLSPAAAGGIAVFTIGLTLATVAWVTWKPARVSPVIVLNDRA